MYENLGIEGDRALLVSGIYNVVGPIFNLIFITLLIDRVGRRKPLIFGTIGISIALICEAAIGSQIPGATGSRRNGLSAGGVFFLFAVSCIFSVSFGPISWVYASEVMPLSIRGRGSAFATGIGNWLVGTIWSQVSPVGLGKITYKFYFIFVAFNLLVTLPTVFFLFKVSEAQVSLGFWNRYSRTQRKLNSYRLRRLTSSSVIVRLALCLIIWTTRRRRSSWSEFKTQGRFLQDIRLLQCTRWRGFGVKEQRKILIRQRSLALEIHLWVDQNMELRGLNTLG
jgi:hypothetical protein